jgi:ABC-type Fe3+-hydroxamate transport system substrate-binding protein
MPPNVGPDPRYREPRAAIIKGLVAEGGGLRRVFVDGAGLSVPMPAAVRRVVATDTVVGALLLEVGAQLVGCAGALDGVETVGPPREPDAAAVAALRPDVIVVSLVDGAIDLADERLAAALVRVAPVVAVDPVTRARTVPDLRALVGRAPAPRTPVQPPPPRPW